MVRRVELPHRRLGDGTNEIAEYDGAAWRRLGRWSCWAQQGATRTAHERGTGR